MVHVTSSGSCSRPVRPYTAVPSSRCGPESACRECAELFLPCSTFSSVFGKCCLKLCSPHWGHVEHNQCQTIPCTCYKLHYLPMHKSNRITEMASMNRLLCAGGFLEQCWALRQLLFLCAARHGLHSSQADWRPAKEACLSCADHIRHHRPLHFCLNNRHSNAGCKQRGSLCAAPTTHKLIVLCNASRLKWGELC